VAMACRVRLRPVLMTSLATILGMVPMALALEAVCSTRPRHHRRSHRLGPGHCIRCARRVPLGPSRRRDCTTRARRRSLR
jgi:hypothetical protein